MTRYLNSFSARFMLLLFLAVFLTGCATPADTLYDFKKSFNEKNWDKAWSLLTEKDRKNFEDTVFKPIKENAKKNPQTLKLINLTEDEFKKMDAKDFFGHAMINSMGTQQQGAFTFEVENQRVLKKQATVKLKNDPNEYLLEKEGLNWKISLKGLTSKR